MVLTSQMYLHRVVGHQEKEKIIPNQSHGHQRDTRGQSLQENHPVGPHIPGKGQNLAEVDPVAGHFLPLVVNLGQGQDLGHTAGQGHIQDQGHQLVQGQSLGQDLDPYHRFHLKALLIPMTNLRRQDLWRMLTLGKLLNVQDRLPISNQHLDIGGLVDQWDPGCQWDIWGLEVLCLQGKKYRIKGFLYLLPLLHF